MCLSRLLCGLAGSQAPVNTPSQAAGCRHFPDFLASRQPLSDAGEPGRSQAVEGLICLPERKFGVVVVGVGRAGSVRIRDLRNPHPSSAFLNLIGFVSRRELGSVEGVPQISLEDALSSQEVEVAYICSENSSHEDYIRQFLNAGKHVLVEYPMTLSWAAARDLWDLAEQKGRVLHEEHVELLMEEFAFLKKEVVGKDLLKGSLLFTAGPLEEERFGFPAFSGISRLTWLVSLFGELSLVSATLEQRKEDQYMKMTVCLETENKRPLTWIEEKAPGLKRNRHLSFHFKSGSLENMPNVGVNKNIFLKDQNIFVQKLLGQFSEKELAAEKKRILHCLWLAEEIQKHCCSKE
ncbi:biliverdin reductase A isoform X3 [Equus asinus]|uniref:Biliverdin reductase A n=1 Tax=Equus asinus TaxID=9793 RepID=A0A9L0JV13_EQUAS|nr:biliverdin reductase A isoform X4 [Equus asinus]